MSGITLVVEDAQWRAHRGLQARLKAAADAARKAAKLRGDVTILLADNRRLKILNRDFRGKDRPTNVLSFPSNEKDYRGDIALAYGVTSAEAQRVKELEREVKELRRANEILKAASAFFARELDPRLPK